MAKRDENPIEPQYEAKSFEEMLRDSSDPEGGVDLSWLYEALVDAKVSESIAPAPKPLVPEGAAMTFSRPAYYGRPVERIPEFLEKLGEIWMSSFPDWRFGQLMCNLDRAYRARHDNMDFFYLEEDAFMAFLEEFSNR